MKPLDYWNEKAAQQPPTTSGDWHGVIDFFGNILELIVTLISL